MNALEPVSTGGDADADEAFISGTRRWIERAVIGLNLCPFARGPYLDQRVAFRVSQARDSDALLDDLCGELQSLHAADPADCETALLIAPFVLADFLDFNDFLDAADAAIDVLKLDGIIQVASFHPQYCFADSAADDIENCTNRSPWPTLHLLREASVERAVDTLNDSEDIYRRNMDALRKLGWTGWSRLWREGNAGE
jgi:uncharacterized protein